jgi:hypothetical protein
MTLQNDRPIFQDIPDAVIFGEFSDSTEVYLCLSGKLVDGGLPAFPVKYSEFVLHE